jgi:DNA-binding response OmpR family regulator
MAQDKYKILLVEDDEFLAELYSLKLTEEGYDVFLAHNGEKGLRYAREKKPSLILLDIILPKMDGMDVLRALKNDKALKSIPVVLLTNLSHRGEVEKGLAAGAKDYLIKAHFMPGEVVEKVGEILK